MKKPLVLITIAFHLVSCADIFSEIRRPIEEWELFNKREWKHITKWECQKYDKKINRCSKPCIVLKSKKETEINCYGITIRSNFDFYAELISLLNTTEETRNNLICVHPFETYVKDKYFRDYYLPFTEEKDCKRFMAFDIAVLSGVNRAKKIIKESKNKKEIKKKYLEYLSKLKSYYKYKNGWIRRVNEVYKKSPKCP